MTRLEQFRVLGIDPEGAAQWLRGYQLLREQQAEYRAKKALEPRRNNPNPWVKPNLNELSDTDRNLQFRLLLDR